MRTIHSATAPLRQIGIHAFSPREYNFGFRYYTVSFQLRRYSLLGGCIKPKKKNQLWYSVYYNYFRSSKFDGSRLKTILVMD